MVYILARECVDRLMFVTKYARDYEIGSAKY